MFLFVVVVVIIVVKSVWFNNNFVYKFCL